MTVTERRFLTSALEADSDEPGLIMEDDGTVWVIGPDGSRFQVAASGGGGPGLPPQWTVDAFGNLSIDSDGSASYTKLLELLGEEIGGTGSDVRGHLVFNRGGGLEVTAGSGTIGSGSALQVEGGGCAQGGATAYPPGGGDGSGPDDQIGMGVTSDLGSDGNNWTIQAVSDGPDQVLSITVDAPGKAITVHLATDGAGAVTSTWEDVADALDNFGDPIDYGYVNLSGGTAAAFAPVQLSGGRDEATWDGYLIQAFPGLGQTLPFLRFYNWQNGREVTIDLEGDVHGNAFIDSTGDLRAAIEAAGLPPQWSVDGHGAVLAAVDGGSLPALRVDANPGHYGLMVALADPFEVLFGIISDGSLHANLHDGAAWNVSHGPDSLLQLSEAILQVGVGAYITKEAGAGDADDVLMVQGRAGDGSSLNILEITNRTGSWFYGGTVGDRIVDFMDEDGGNVILSVRKTGGVVARGHFEMQGDSGIFTGGDAGFTMSGFLSDALTITASAGNRGIRINDHNGAAVFEVRDNGTVHIKTGSAIVADL